MSSVDIDAGLIDLHDERSSFPFNLFVLFEQHSDGRAGAYRGEPGTHGEGRGQQSHVANGGLNRQSSVAR
jgi:hypothetical protein